MDKKETEINEENIVEEALDPVETEAAGNDAETVSDEELDASAIVDSVWEDDQVSGTSDIADEADMEEATEKRSSKPMKRRKTYDLSEYEGKEIPDDVFRKLPFSEKLKHDLVLPLCLALIVFIFAGAMLYYFMSAPSVKTFGYTYDEFLNRFYASETYEGYLSAWGLKVDKTNYTLNGFIPDTSDNSEIVNDVKLHDLSKIRNDIGLKTFSSEITNARDCQILGAVRNSDNQLAYIRFLAKYDDVSTNPAFITYFYTTVFETVFDDMSFVDASMIVNDTLNQFTGGDTGYIIKDDYAFRLMLGKYEGTVYVALDITPNENAVA